MSKRKTRVRLGRFLLLAYIILAAYFLFFSESLDRTMVSDNFRYNLTPFSEIRRFLTYSNQLGVRAVLDNLVGNIVCFMPMGFLIPTIAKRRFFKYFLGVLITCATVSLTVETIQLIGRVGAFDIDDIILNSLGGAMGFATYKLVKLFYRKKLNGANK